MTDTLGLSASLEDYLEAIYNIIKEKKGVRAKDIAARLKVSNASVTGALRTLAKGNYLDYAPYDVITLTGKGEEAAREIVRRHEVLRDFLVTVLAVEYKTADDAACLLEHGMPDEIVDRLVSFIEFIEVCPLGGAKLIEGFRRHLECGIDKGKCTGCLEDVRNNLESGMSDVNMSDSTDLSFTQSGFGSGQKYVVKKVKASGGLKKKLLEMGLTPGSLIEIERIAPMGDPVEIKIRGYHLSLRRDELECLEVAQV